MERIYYLKKNKKLFYLFLIGTILPLFFGIFVVYMLQNQMEKYLLGVFEKKTIDNLNSYHTSTKRSVGAYFVQSVETLEKISQSNHFMAPIYIKTPAELNEELRFQLKINPQFLTLAITDAKGIVRQVVSREPVVEKTLGKRTPNIDSFTKVITTGKPFIGKPIVGPISKTTQIGISVPIIEKGKTTFVLEGYISLKQITEDMNISSVFYDKSSILANTDGTIIIGTIPEKDKLMNLAKYEPIYDKLTTSSKQIYMGDEYNYQGEKTFAIGEKISILQNKDILLFSFLEKRAFEEERRGLNYTIYKLTAYLTFAWIAINGILFIVLSISLYTHDKK